MALNISGLMVEFPDMPKSANFISFIPLNYTQMALLLSLLTRQIKRYCLFFFNYLLSKLPKRISLKRKTFSLKRKTFFLNRKTFPKFLFPNQPQKNSMKRKTFPMNRKTFILKRKTFTIIFKKYKNKTQINVVYLKIILSIE